MLRCEINVEDRDRFLCDEVKGANADGASKPEGHRPQNAGSLFASGLSTNQSNSDCASAAG